MYTFKNVHDCSYNYYSLVLKCPKKFRKQAIFLDSEQFQNIMYKCT